MRNPFEKKQQKPFAADMFRSARHRERKHMRKRWQWITLAVVVVLAAAGGTLLYFYLHLEHGIQFRSKETQAAPPGRPFNALLVGSDSRAGLSKKAQEKLGANYVPGINADTIILAHIDPADDTVIMMQFPRDLWLELPGKGKAKINSAVAYGPDYLIKTLKSITGLEINHYVQVDLQGFRQVVDALGGVEVCVPEKIPFDSHTGLEVTKPGMIHFNGNEALRFVRARHVFATGDFARIQNQQKFLAAAVQKATSVSSILNPSHVVGLYHAVKDNVLIDDGLNIPELRNLLSKIRNIDPEHYQAYTVPNLGATEITTSDGTRVSIVRPDRPGMKAMFHAIADNERPSDVDEVPDIEPGTIRVGVYNATGEAGAASRAATELKQATRVGQGGGVDIVEIGNAPRFGLKKTVVRYSAESRNMADLVAAALPGAKLKQVGHTYAGTDVDVFVGRHFDTKQIVQILPIPLPTPGNPPPACRHPGRLGHGG
jgi:LCP family protein required for cell wall assembly